MKGFELRLRHKFTSSMSVAEVMDSILNKLKQTSDDIEGSTLINHAYLKIKEDKQHYWSPELHITVEENSDGALIRAVAGPKPKIWTMFMFFYTAVIAFFLFGSALGVSQYMLNIEAPWLWSIPASFLGALIVYGAAKFGQYKGRNQLILLNNFTHEAISEGEKQKG